MKLITKIIKLTLYRKSIKATIISKKPVVVTIHKT